ncbi:MAG: hypothetical protein WC225_01515 [Acholeplasmataceae bacterium]|nr:hypothetical protein [Acholeplasmataceae bacterium]
MKYTLNKNEYDKRRINAEIRILIALRHKIENLEKVDRRLDPDYFSYGPVPKEIEELDLFLSKNEFLLDKTEFDMAKNLNETIVSELETRFNSSSNKIAVVKSARTELLQHIDTLVNKFQRMV